MTACLDALSVRFGNVYLTVFREEGAHKVVVNGQLVTLESASVTVGQDQLRRLQQQQYGTDLPAGSVRVKREGVETTVVTLANGVRVKITGASLGPLVHQCVRCAMLMPGCCAHCSDTNVSACACCNVQLGVWPAGQLQLECYG